MKVGPIGMIAVVAMVSIGYAQMTDPPKRLEFDVASIHLSKPAGYQAMKANADGAGYTASYVPVRLMISVLYRIPARQIKGGPGWLGDDRYDVEAKADKRYTADDLDTMYKNLLADRFKLKFHIETKEGNVYALTVDKGGSRMMVNDKPQDYEWPIQFSGIGVMNAVRVPMRFLCWNLGQFLSHDERPVVDRTGLTGYYDFKLTFLPPTIEPEVRDTLGQDVLDRPSLFAALKEQLGLKLTAQKGPVQYLVIDSVERPSEN